MKSGPLFCVNWLEVNCGTDNKEFKNPILIYERVFQEFNPKKTLHVWMHISFANFLSDTTCIFGMADSPSDRSVQRERTSDFWAAKVTPQCLGHPFSLCGAAVLRQDGHPGPKRHADWVRTRSAHSVPPTTATLKQPPSPVMHLAARRLDFAPGPLGGICSRPSAYYFVFENRSFDHSLKSMPPPKHKKVSVLCRQKKPVIVLHTPSPLGTTLCDVNIIEANIKKNIKKLKK